MFQLESLQHTVVNLHPGEKATEIAFCFQMGVFHQINQDVLRFYPCIDLILGQGLHGDMEAGHENIRQDVVFIPGCWSYENRFREDDCTVFFNRSMCICEAVSFDEWETLIRNRSQDTDGRLNGDEMAEAARLVSGLIV